MGYEVVQLSATSRVSKHNSPQDDEDAARWNLFVARVRRLADQSDLDVDVSAESLDIHGW